MGCIAPCNIVGLANRYLIICTNDWADKFNYRSGTVNSKSFVGKVFASNKWKFKLNYTL